MPTIKYKKGLPLYLSKHFKTTDFDCHCTRKDCVDTYVDESLMQPLEELYKLCGGFTITSGYRCVEHNKEVGGKPNSQHLLGKAADCKSLKGYTGHAMARYAEQVKEFFEGGIGIYRSFAHCDIREEKARWSVPIDC